MALLEIRNFSKRYGDQVILEQEKLDIHSGTHLLTGANGSGKSTFLKIIAGMVPFEGEITLLETIRLQKDHQKHRQSVSYAESEPQFPPYLTGNYLLEMFQKIRGSNQEEIQNICTQLGIREFLNQKISGYSSGMKKKLALLLAFLGSSSLILLDEPFNALDIQAKSGLESLIREQIQSGRNFILATHVHGQRPSLPFVSEILVSDKVLQSKDLIA